MPLFVLLDSRPQLALSSSGYKLAISGPSGEPETDLGRIFNSTVTSQYFIGITPDETKEIILLHESFLDFQRADR